MWIGEEMLGLYMILGTSIYILIGCQAIYTMYGHWEDMKRCCANRCHVGWSDDVWFMEGLIEPILLLLWPIFYLKFRKFIIKFNKGDIPGANWRQ